MMPPGLGLGVAVLPIESMCAGSWEGLQLFTNLLQALHVVRSMRGKAVVYLGPGMHRLLSQPPNSRDDAFSHFDTVFFIGSRDDHHNLTSTLVVANAWMFIGHYAVFLAVKIQGSSGGQLAFLMQHQRDTALIVEDCEVTCFSLYANK
jgi:hypothetical protein